eukprot:jgi/Chrzof1/1461/Cz10g08230.t1
MEVMGLCTIRASTGLGLKLPGIIHVGISLSSTPTVPNFSGLGSTQSATTLNQPLMTSIPRWGPVRLKKAMALVAPVTQVTRVQIPAQTNFSGLSK